MDAVSLDPDAYLGGRERLVVDAADLRAVERVREVGAELLDVEVGDPTPHFLVDGEADTDGSVLDLRVRREVGDRAHDLGDACLVVRAEQRRAVGRDDVVARPLGEDRILACAQHLARIAGEDDVAAVVVPDHLRLDVRAGFVGARVHVCDQPDRRARGAGKSREHIAVLGELHVLEPDLPQLFGEHLAEVELLRRARVRLRVVVRLRVDLDVAQEAVEHVVSELGGDRGWIARVRQARPIRDRAR